MIASNRRALDQYALFGIRERPMERGVSEARGSLRGHRLLVQVLCELAVGILGHRDEVVPGSFPALTTDPQCFDCRERGREGGIGAGYGERGVGKRSERAR